MHLDHLGMPKIKDSMNQNPSKFQHDQISAKQRQAWPDLQSYCCAAAPCACGCTLSDSSAGWRADTEQTQWGSVGVTHLALVLLFQHVREDLEDSQTGGCVCGLSKETSG